MTQIARDEAQHALLSLDVHAWASTRLDARALARASRPARRDAALALAADAEHCVEDAELGLPSGADARQLAVLGA